MDRFDEMRGKNKAGSAPSVVLPDGGTMTSIMISQPAYKLSYDEGDSFDINGLQVVGIYDNGRIVDITNFCTIVVDNPLTAFSTTVTVNYESFTTTFEIEVKAKGTPIPAGAMYLYHFDGNGTDTMGSGTNYSTSGGFRAGKFGQANTAGSGTLPKLASLDNVFQYAGYTYTFDFWMYFSNIYDQVNYSHQWYWGETGRYDSAGLFLDLTNETTLKLSTKFKSFTYTSEESLKGKWLHIAITIDKDSVITLFVNGKKVGSASFKITYNYGIGSSYEKRIGGGSIDELLITNNVLHTSDFLPPLSPYGGEE